MTHVVTEACVNCRYSDCVTVCPVNCFKVGPNFLVIDPDGCIDCGLCIPECPVDAIYADDDMPDDQREFIDLNAALAREWPTITEKSDPLPEAAAWKDRDRKRDLIAGLSGRLEHADAE